MVILSHKVFCNQKENPALVRNKNENSWKAFLYYLCSFISSPTFHLKSVSSTILCITPRWKYP